MDTPITLLIFDPASNLLINWESVILDINIPSIENLDDTFLQSYLRSQSIKTYYSTILQDYDNTPIGFISLEYYKTTRELTEEQLDEFNEIAIKISVLINIK